MVCSEIIEDALEGRSNRPATLSTSGQGGPLPSGSSPTRTLLPSLSTQVQAGFSNVDLPDTDSGSTPFYRSAAGKNAAPLPGAAVRTVALAAERAGIGAAAKRCPRRGGGAVPAAAVWPAGAARVDACANRCRRPGASVRRVAPAAERGAIAASALAFPRCPAVRARAAGHQRTAGASVGLRFNRTDASASEMGLFF
jgi:hypothetical protein